MDPTFVKLKIRDDPEEVNKCLAAAYKRRGEPLKHTGWNPDQIFQYMIWNFDKGQKDNWNPDKYGGFSWLLPSKSATGEPANLPQEVLDFHAAKKEKKAKEVKDKEKFNFNLKIKNNTMYLRRVTDNKKIELSLGPSWKLYDDKDGKVLWAGSDCPIRPEFCHKIFNNHSDKDQTYAGATKKLSGVAQASQPLPGMVATSQGLFVANQVHGMFNFSMVNKPGSSVTKPPDTNLCLP